MVNRKRLLILGIATCGVIAIWIWRLSPDPKPSRKLVHGMSREEVNSILGPPTGQLRYPTDTGRKMPEVMVHILDHHRIGGRKAVYFIFYDDNGRMSSYDLGTEPENPADTPEDWRSLR